MVIHCKYKSYVGVSHHVTVGCVANISEEHTASIFRVKAQITQTSNRSAHFDPEDGGSAFF
jgi:hypothetical protein